MNIPSTPNHRLTADDIPPSAAAAQRTSPETIPYDVDQIKADMEECSLAVWDVNGMLDMQKNVIVTLFDPNTPNNMIAAFPTGSGKSHIIRVVGTMHRGITLIFIPLLTLSANVMAKFDSAFQSSGSVRSYHLDELFDNNKERYNEVIDRCRDLPPATESTVFIFLSPQHLGRCNRSLKTFINCSWRGTLRSIFMDEVHLHVQQGLSFRKQCRELRDQLLAPCMHPPNQDYFVPRFVGLSATFPNEYIRGLQKLTSIRFSSASIMRGGVEEFCNTAIHMKQAVVNKGEYVKTGLSEVVVNLPHDSDNKVIVFCNSRGKADHFAKELERKLNDAGKKFDVIVITGALNKNEKFWRIRILCGNEEEFVGECSFRAGVFTNACNVGVDDSRINYCVRFGLPRDLNTYLQERGRGSRQPGSLSTFMY